MNQPQAKKIPHHMTLHGETRTDNYFWLRDDDRQNPEVLAYLEAENRYGKAMMASQDALQDRVLKEIIDRLPAQDHSVPYVRNGYRYQSRYEAGNEYAAYFRQPVDAPADQPWQLLLDGNQRAAHSDFYTMGTLDISPDNQVMALAEDFLSRRQYGIRFRNLNSGSWYPEVLRDASSSVAWANDSRTLYYVRKHPKTLLAYQVWRHELGHPQSEDQLVYEEQDESFHLSVHKTTSEHFILIALFSTTTSEILLIDAEYPDAQPQVFCPRRRDHEYSIDHYDHQFFIRSNRDGKNFGLYRSAWLAEDRWQTLIPPRDHVVMEDFQLFRNWLVVEERQRGVNTLRQINWASGESYGIAFDDPAYVTWLAYNPTPESDTLRYGYSSMTTPTTLFELNMETGERRILKQTPVPGFDSADYKSEHLWITVRDGTEVPVSLVYHRKHFQRGANPLLAYGYGAYGSSMEASFGTSRISLLERGFIYAIIHVRGGGELGQQWYDDGRLQHKMNSFTDFIDVTEALVAKGYGNPQQLYAMGGSAGGLLMGGVLNMAPQLFHGVIAQVPFVDVVTTMLDPSIPLTTGEYDEWGNPEQAEFYRYIRQYSPYDNVTAQAYPHLLVTTGLHDSQVQYWEPAKWVAKLRELRTNDALLLLCTDMDSGHGGKSGRYKSYEGVAQEFTFLIALAQGTLPPRSDY
ncbi:MULTISPECIES: prolyl oligopeptidase family serine peptidase [Pantoea]|uniref:prolyl oligopeptidase family serine peptidase n=1 Tax=Pantoea TaxID=53335 RepID=UPI000CE4716C|nr:MULTISPECIES: prolyl oligopeptidase family serine peptidase [Pantoea]NIG35793.1 prolyl oligopeptidase family serine peptidase [Pantoea sp. Ap-959]PPC66387.1 oligopeptidase B [Pantoea sp. ICBG 828]UYV59027.1 prolyl oligopeptidase family serine peptidase [Pantoea dispersa]